MQLPHPFRERDGQIEVELAGARAIFTTRAWGDVRDTEAQIADRLGLRLIRPRQVHGSAVATVSGAPPAAGPETEADGVVTATPGLAPTVITADCLPIVIAGANAVATVHAGWRGLEAGVIANAVRALRAFSAGVLCAAIGPGAGVCCYAVGDELHRRFHARCQDFRAGQNLDLKAIARVQLMQAGVATIFDAGICTICADPALLYSYRREGPQTGRQAAIAWLS